MITDAFTKGSAGWLWWWLVVDADVVTSSDDVGLVVGDGCVAKSV